MHRDLPYIIALSKINGIGPITAKTLISYCGSAEAIFSESKKSLSKIPQIGGSAVQLIYGKDVVPLYEEELSFIQQKGLKVFSYRDTGYPERLKHVPESPIVLYHLGSSDLNAKRMLAIVGTRKPSAYGISQCEKLIAELAEYDIVTVSGLAYGIDACAHKQSLQFDIPTIGVMGTSFETLYPASHRSLAAKMIDQGGLLTEFPKGTRRDKENFPMRNRIIAGMTDGLIVVESAAKGGSMISATFAHAYNKEVMALPGRNNDPLSQGCNNLIQQHKAALIKDGADIANLLNWSKPNEQNSAIQASLFEPLGDIESNLLEIIQEHPKIHIDKLVGIAKITPGEIASSLLQLEFKGLIKSLPGKRYLLV